MSPCPSSLPIDVPSLTRLVLALQARNDDLQGRVAFLERQLFGAKSERLATVEPTQGALDLGDLSDAPAAANDDAPARESGRRVSHPPVRRNIGALPRHLPRCERVIEPESLTCPCCSGALHRIGADVSEALDVVPAILRVIRTIRPRYACRHCMSSVVQAPAPSRVMNGSMASTALVSHVVVAKFGWHLPLHRQSQMLASRGVFVDRGTLGHWVERAAWWLKPLHERLLDFIRQQQRVFCDETPLPRLDPGRKRTKICQLWAQAIDDRPWQGPAPPAVGYVFAESRSAREAEAQLRSFSGVLQVDGYGSYKTLVERRRRMSNAGPLQLAFCLAHARRKFVEVVKTTGSSEALAIVSLIAGIYRIEGRIRGTDAEMRLRVRRAESAPIMAELKECLAALVAETSQQSSLNKACRYMLNHWSGLMVFVSDGRVEVDSNVVERSMKSVALTRRNALFAGSARGGETWAILASLVNTAKLNGVDPEIWLGDVLERIVSGEVTVNRLDDLLPWRWKAEREALSAGLNEVAA